MASGKIKIELDEESMQIVEKRIEKLKNSLVEVQELLMSIQPTVKTSEDKHTCAGEWNGAVCWFCGE